MHRGDHIRQRQTLRYARRERRRAPRGIRDEPPALEPVAELRRVALDLVDAVVVDGSGDVQTLADLHATGETQLAAEPAASPLGLAGRGRGFQPGEVAIQNEVDDTADRVRAVLRGGATGDDVDVLDQPHR